MVGKMSSPQIEESMVPIDNIVYKSFAKRFNQEYSTKLLPPQKTLLNKFATSFHNNGLDLKTYLNEEISQTDALKKAIALSPKAYKKMSIQGREHVRQNYNFETFEKDWVTLMDHVVEDYGSWETRRGYERWHLLEVA